MAKSRRNTTIVLAKTSNVNWPPILAKKFINEYYKIIIMSSLQSQQQPQLVAYLNRRSEPNPSKEKKMFRP